MPDPVPPVGDIASARGIGLALAAGFEGKDVPNGPVIGKEGSGLRPCVFPPPSGRDGFWATELDVDDEMGAGGRAGKDG